MTTVDRAPAPVAPAIPPGLDTPCLVVDLDIAAANARRMAEGAAARGVVLRPHVKTHKSVRLARLQLDAGAVGVTVGTIGEAEAMVDGGILDVFIGYPVWAEGPKAERLRTLHERSSTTVGVDSGEAAGLLAAAVEGSTAGPLRVLVELDSGARRSGVANSAAALEVARHAREAGLEVIGVFTPGGHGYRAPGAGPSAAADEVAILGDRQQFVLGAIPAEGIAVAVATTVVSVAVDGQVVLDAGAKTLTKDRAPFLDGFGAIPAYPDAVIERLFDYHAAVRVAPGAPAPRLGEVVAVVPNHVCPVVEQFYDFVVARAGLAEGRWPVDARGRSR